ncbi:MULTISPECIES: 4Fe-4S single cluster domain-containing protein [unclassified Vibrio]|uniref:4Fe-4S single cluster domain-containing protein n=1 Tax=unclassified Vibrio TaxID=2614977 RepID=UPI000BFFB2F8|nr:MULTISPECIES: 4Fe-4S single cluster domain-containing protein [unclassified Vibrio]PHJ40559.1 hypothetical protein AK965_15955 [Vibrio sp. PID17_43]RIZ55338.1 hypothetical protein AK966_08455 [Vibrio sp. PID23_8]
MMAVNYGEYFNLAHVEPLSHIYGPGQRFVVWLQGCRLACPGCWNTDMWSFSFKEKVHRTALLQQILSETEIQGVTFLGGEPLHQSENLWWLMEQIRQHSDLTIFLFTGYEEEELTEQGNMHKIESLCDIAAIGRFDINQRNIQQQWIGSDNQKLLYPLNSREQQNQQLQNEVEIIICEDESIRVLGFPDHNLSLIFGG